jgi:hypothetical protein
MSGGQKKRAAFFSPVKDVCAPSGDDLAAIARPMVFDPARYALTCFGRPCWRHVAIGDRPADDANGVRRDEARRSAAATRRRRR